MKNNYEKLTQFLMLFAFLAFSNTAMAQGTVTGTVSDADGPLIGATVRIVGKATGTITDFDGNYSLEIAPGGYTFEATYTGYTPNQQTITVASGDNRLDFSLEEGVLLNDVVVTGTRSKPRTAISSPVPIDNFVGEVIDKSGNGDLTENIKNIVPSFSATPLTGDGAAFVRPTSLRGLPPDEVLVLSLIHI